jgi:hypothetical protein
VGDHGFRLAGGWVLGRLRFFGGSFSQGFFQVGVEFVEFGHGQLRGPFFELLNVQCGVKADSGFNVVGESGAEVAGLRLGIADLPAGVSVIKAAACVPVAI